MNMMDWLTTTIIAEINIALILGLLYVYVKNMIKIKSGFTFGLVLFGILFLLHNILVFYFSITMMPLYADGVSPYMFVFTLFQAFAFGILNWVTWK